MKTTGNSPMSRNSPISSQRMLLNPEKARLKDDLKCKQSLKSSKKSLFFQELCVQQSKERSHSRISLISKPKLVFERLSNMNVFPTVKQVRCQCRQLWQSQEKFNSYVKKQLCQLKSRDQRPQAHINYRQAKAIMVSQLQRLAAVQKSAQRRELVSRCLEVALQSLGEQEETRPGRKSVSFSEMIRASKESLQRISQESLTEQNFTQRESLSAEYQKF